MNLETKYWYLHGHQLFSMLSSADLKEICFITKFKTAKKGEIIYFSDDETKRVYTVKKGIIKIVELDSNGNEVVKDILQQGDLFGQLSYGEAPQNEYAVVISDSFTCCSFQTEEFEQLIEKKPALAIKYTKWIGFRLKRVENRYANLMFKDVRTRLLLYLKDWAAKDGKKIDNKTIIKNYLTHQDIANLICSTRQTVTQLFNDLREKEILEYSRTEIIINNLTTLS